MKDQVTQVTEDNRTSCPRWAIVSVTGMAWSNTHGWVDDQSYDVFTPEEQQALHLSVGGHWMPLAAKADET